MNMSRSHMVLRRAAFAPPSLLQRHSSLLIPIIPQAEPASMIGEDGRISHCVESRLRHKMTRCPPFLASPAHKVVNE